MGMSSETFFKFTEEEEIYKLSAMTEKLFARLLRVSRHFYSYTKTTVSFLKNLLLFNLITQTTVFTETAVPK